MKVLKNLFVTLLCAFGMMFGLTTSAHAAIDLTAVLAAITDAGSAAGTLGAAVLVVMVTIGVFVWLRRPVK